MDAATEKNLLRTLPSYYNNNHDLNLLLQCFIPLEKAPLHPPLSKASRTIVKAGDKALKKIKKKDPERLMFYSIHLQPRSVVVVLHLQYDNCYPAR